VFWAFMEKADAGAAGAAAAALVLLVLAERGLELAHEVGVRRDRDRGDAADWRRADVRLLMDGGGDRVVMNAICRSRRRFRRGLLPGQAPRCQGGDCVCDAPRNTVAGDYYDVVARPDQGGKTFLIAVADCGGQERSGGDADGDIPGELNDAERHVRPADGISGEDESVCMQPTARTAAVYDGVYRGVRSGDTQAGRM